MLDKDVVSSTQLSTLAQTTAPRMDLYELEVAIRSLDLQRSQDELVEMVRAMDIDGDGNVDQEEFVQMVPDEIVEAISIFCDQKGPELMLVIEPELAVDAGDEQAIAELSTALCKDVAEFVFLKPSAIAVTSFEPSVWEEQLMKSVCKVVLVLPKRANVCLIVHILSL